MTSAAASISGASIDALLLGLVIVWVYLSGARPGERQLGIAALFCILPSVTPIAWLEYYVALIVPYTLLAAVCAGGVGSSNLRWSARARRLAGFALICSLILNVASRIFEPALFYGMPYFSSLMLLAILWALRNLSAAENRFPLGPGLSLAQRRD